MRSEISKATLRRYPVYLKALRKLKSTGVTHIMSKDLSNFVNIESTTIRRDFSLIGKLGKQGYGYDVDALIEVFSKELGVSFDEDIILVGVGNLGKALLNYNKWNYVVGEIVCAYDLYPENVKGVDVPVYNINDIKETKPSNCRIAILCGQHNIQETVDKLIDAGIVGFVDFSNEHFSVPRGVEVRTIDVVSSVQELVFSINRVGGK